MSKKERKVFLLGAGAAIPWNGPTTKCLTQIICQSGFKNSSGKYITQEIYDYLKEECKTPEKEINFETIINVIEDFIDFWSYSGQKSINGLSFFISENHNLWNTFINYKVKDDSGSKTYSIEIPDASAYPQASLQRISKDELPQKIFFQTLIIEILDVISCRISDYSNDPALKKHETNPSSQLAIDYFTRLNNSYLRIYTLNYDRIIQFILRKAEISFIEGLVDDTLTDISKENWEPRPFAPYKILKESDCNSVYHLHGSVFWEVVDEDLNRLPYYTYVLKRHPILPSTYGEPIIQMEPGRRTLVSNIISGYRKTTRTGLSPVRQMFSAFDRDCYSCDTLTIVGYSFGDEHINDIIYKACNYNTSVEIEIVDPNIDIKGFFSGMVTKWTWFENLVEPQKLCDTIYRYPDYKLTIYKMFFQDYLKIKCR